MGALTKAALNALDASLLAPATLAGLSGSTMQAFSDSQLASLTDEQVFVLSLAQVGRERLGAQVGGGHPLGLPMQLWRRVP